MDPEEQEVNEFENGTPEEQEQASSGTNISSGSVIKKAQQTRKASGQFKKGAKKYAKKGARTAQKSVQATRVAAQVARQFAIRVASSIIGLLGAKVIIFLIICAILVIILNQLGILGASTSSNQQITVSGPIFAKIGDKLDYVITINHPGATQNIVITNQIPDGAEYLYAPEGLFNPVTNTVTWNLAEVIKSNPSSTSAANNTSSIFSLTLLATKDNNYIVNTLKGKIQEKVFGLNDSLPIETPMKTDQPSAIQLPPIAYPLTPKFTNPNSTPTIFQPTPTNTFISPQEENIIKACVVTKVGEPVAIPPLPLECTEF